MKSVLIFKILQKLAADTNSLAVKTLNGEMLDNDETVRIALSIIEEAQKKLRGE